MIVIIQARSSSKRFPNKVLYKIKSKPLILHVVNRVKLSKKVKKIIVAISSDKSDHKLASLLKSFKINYVRGSLNNVALRLYKAAKANNSNYFLRISGDSPFIDPKIIDKAVTIFRKHKKIDIVTNVFPRTFPSGQSVEIIKTMLLKKYLRYMNIYQKEHVVPFFYSNSKKFKIINFKSKIKHKKAMKFSIDLKSDLKKMINFFPK